MLALNHFSRVRLCEPMAHQALLFMEFSRQKYWSVLPCPPAWDVPNLGIKPATPVSCISCIAGRSFTAEPLREASFIDSGAQLSEPELTQLFCTWR